ncbi:hypothetical protein ACWEPL_34100 [Nonomuraea sp. NPDC004186]
MRLAHSAVGPIDRHCETLLSPAEDQRLIIFTPAPGTSAIEHLRLLRVLGHDDFGAAQIPAFAWNREANRSCTVMGHRRTARRLRCIRTAFGCVRSLWCGSTPSRSRDLSPHGRERCPRIELGEHL